ARKGADPEGVHQVRVAGRRLRVWLELGGYQVLHDDLRWLVRGAGKVRDLEVMLQNPLPKSFAAWLAEELEAAREELTPMLDSPRLIGLTRALHHLPPLPIPEAEKRLERFERRVQKREAAWNATETFEDLHALRRALRRLRYAREYLEQDVEDLKALQEALGRLNDADVALHHLDEFEGSGGRAAPSYRKSLETQREKGLAAAHELLAKG
ncbi:MAG TPA: CHAD domain-containing protein, partial [Meiothermus sp.]|nr:CHAD domain-containing protein [Meiothermus sp.]